MIRIILIFLSYYNCQALIVPQELPSLLSLVYSTIPQIRKGSDSRYGFGFRLGDHADFQVLVEVGPQIETKPIGKASDDSDSGSSLKRNVEQSDYVPSKEDRIRNFQKQKSSDWLKQWQKNAKISQSPKLRPTVKSKAEKMAAIKMIPVLNEAALSELLSLYKSMGSQPRNQQNAEIENKTANNKTTERAIVPNVETTDNLSASETNEETRENTPAFQVILA